MKNKLIIIIILFLLFYHFDAHECNEKDFFRFKLPSDNYTYLKWGMESNNIYFNTIENGKWIILNLDINSKKISRIGNKDSHYILLDNCLSNGTLLVSCYDTSESLVLLSEEGDILKSLPVSSDILIYPVVSPDGKWIAHVIPGLGLNEQVYIYDIENNKDYLIKDYEVADVIDDWSVNNELLYNFYEEKWEGNYSFAVNFNLYAYDINKKQSRQITHFTDCQKTENSLFPTRSEWSPDGEKIACAISISESKQEALAILDKYGNILKLFEVENQNQYLSEPAWSPDGKKIAFLIMDFVEDQDYLQYSLGVIELDPSLQSGPRPEKIPEINVGKFNVYLYGGIAIGILLLTISGFIFVKRIK